MIKIILIYLKKGLVKCLYKTMEELQDEESLCNYCKADPDWHSTSYGDPYCCEGAYCGDAYQTYLDENEITQRMVDVSHKTNVKIERS